MEHLEPGAGRVFVFGNVVAKGERWGMKGLNQKKTLTNQEE
jgi:hypothetical protein